LICWCWCQLLTSGCATGVGVNDYCTLWNSRFRPLLKLPAAMIDWLLAWFRDVLCSASSSKSWISQIHKKLTNSPDLPGPSHARDRGARGVGYENPPSGDFTMARRWPRVLASVPTWERANLGSVVSTLLVLVLVVEGEESSCLPSTKPPRFGGFFFAYPLSGSNSGSPSR
jgi:hypothetical protein